MIEVVAGAIVIDRKLLCVQRGQAKYDYVSYKYEFPGGKVEHEENHQIALKRELLEELNLEVDVGDFVTTVEHHYPDFSIQMHCYLCFAEHYDGTLIDHIAYKYLSLNEFESVDWIEADIPIMEELVKGFGHVFDK